MPLVPSGISVAANVMMSAGQLNSIQVYTICKVNLGPETADEVCEISACNSAENRSLGISKNHSILKLSDVFPSSQLDRAQMQWGYGESGVAIVHSGILFPNPHSVPRLFDSATR